MARRDATVEVSLERLLRLTLRRLDALQRQMLAPLGLTPRQVEVLMMLRGRGGLRQRDLARQVGMDASTLAELAARLAERGLIRRAPHRRDGRALALYLTAKGRRVLMKALPAMREADAALLKGLRASQRHALVQGLAALCGEACESGEAHKPERDGKGR